ncbi:MAG: triose-phosphate isomerase [Lactobacillaceae bacterium]|jgi:triosephosphate isomerase|nr:triose-phosphate isomerase [Lactobacillaceae bacterium]
MTKRNPIVVANWKMNKLPSETIEYIVQIQEQVKAYPEVDMVLAGQDVLLTAMVAAAGGTTLSVGAENVYWQDRGAYTGETSPAALQDLGVKYVIIGHSERRNYFRETDEMVNLKAVAALKHDLIPIIAIDEPISAESESDNVQWVVNQVIESLEGISEVDATKLILAYEPTAAIGSGQAMTPELAQFSLRRIRLTLADMYGWEIANRIRITYGGSVKPANVYELMVQPDIDGVLVGDAALDPHTFVELVKLSAQAMRGSE